ncbi:MAG: hypothetical protein ACFE0O_11355 [Opitutales bacterium]
MAFKGLLYTKKTRLFTVAAGLLAALSVASGQLVDETIAGGVTEASEFDQRVHADAGWFLSTSLAGDYDAANDLFEIRGESSFEGSTDRTTFDRGFGQAFTPDSTGDFHFEIEISNFVGDAGDTIQFSVLLYDTEDGTAFNNKINLNGETDAGNGSAANVDFIGQFDTNILTGTTGTLSTGTISGIDANSDVVSAVFFPVSSSLGFGEGVDVSSVNMVPATVIPEPAAGAGVAGLLGLAYLILRRRS